MNEAAFAQAALPAPTVVLGLVMRPYSLGHELWLLREGNPLAHFSPQKRSVQRTDLVQAALFCCQTWSELGRMNGDWLLPAKLALWRWRVRRMDWERELRLWRQYRNEGTAEYPNPNIVNPSRSPGRAPGCPLIHRLHLFEILQLRISADQAWDLPLGLAQMHYQAMAEANGEYEITNEHDAAFDAFVAEEEAKAEGRATTEHTEYTEREGLCRA